MWIIFSYFLDESGMILQFHCTTELSVIKSYPMCHYDAVCISIVCVGFKGRQHHDMGQACQPER